MSDRARTWRIWVDRPIPAEVAIPAEVEITEDVAAADGVVVGATGLWDGDACRRLPRLKVVARSGIGYDNVAVAACAAAGVAACNAPDGPTASTAEHALALMLAVAKRLKPAEHGSQIHGNSYRFMHDALELDRRTLGLVGCGRIGSRVARYAKALGMKVLIHDPYLDANTAAGVGELVSLDDLWRSSDVISLHAPADENTRHMVNAQSIAAMRPGVMIVNCARGSLVDHDALLAALDSGQVSGAGLDVTEPEPLPQEHPLLGRDDVIITPHVASTTTVGTVRLISQAFEQATAWLRGETPEHLLDPTAGDPAVDRRSSGSKG